MTPNILQEWIEQTQQVHKVFNKLNQKDLRLLENVSGITIDVKETKIQQVCKLMIRFGIPYPNVKIFSQKD